MIHDYLFQKITESHLGVADDNNGKLGSGERHVEAPGVGEEADALVLVRTHTGDDDDVLLPPLEGVNARHLDILVHLGVKRALDKNAIILSTKEYVVGENDPNLWSLLADSSIKDLTIPVVVQPLGMNR